MPYVVTQAPEVQAFFKNAYSIMKLKITKHTFLKAFPLQSTEQTGIPSALLTVSAGDEFEIKSLRPMRERPKQWQRRSCLCTAS